MKWAALVLALAAVPLFVAPASAQSEAIKSMGRSLHGSDDTEWCANQQATLEKRIAFCESAVKSGRLEARAPLARLYRIKGDYDAALKMVQWLINRLGDGGEQDFLLADTYAQMGRFDDARRIIDQLQKGSGVDVDNLNEQCWISAVAGRELERGLAACNQALDLKKQAANVLDSRALTYFKLGRFKDALADYDAVLDGNSHMNSSRYARGVVKLKLGDAAGGKKDMDDATERDLIVAQEMAGYGVSP